MVALRFDGVNTLRSEYSASRLNEVCLRSERFRNHGIISVVCPGFVIEITPAQLHAHCDVLFRAGKLASIFVADPGAQGDAVAGMHGIGVSTPRAAAVAAATSGLAGDWHMPKGRIFIIGM